ncbi:MAG TPA: pyridoxal phosphate-dependent aminotransferase [Bacteroidales bacterium]|nr:pyridoxal phosphate-dependent aminotransferase [Bacteroidales bacterium]
MELLSERLRRLKPSATVAMNQKTKDLQAQGIDIINLSVGEPDFNTPDHVKEAAKKAIDENYSFYTPVAGYPELRQAIVRKLKRENNLEYKPDEIVVSNGAKHAIANTIMSLVDKGDEVVIPSPYWVSYADLVTLAEGTNVIVKTRLEDNFKMSAGMLEEAITPRTKALILCSPSNPTGSVYSYEEMSALADVLRRHPQVFVIADEIYEHINFVGRHVSMAQFEGLRERVITVNGVSKAYAMTGWRIGYMAAAPWIVKACINLQGQFTTGASSIAQRASIAALDGDPQVVENMRQAFERRKNLIVGLVSEIPGIRLAIPDGAFYIFPDVSAFYGKQYNGFVIKNSDDMSLFLLDQGHIATVPGSAFGEDTCIRISYATSDEKISEAIRRMKDALALLK